MYAARTESINREMEFTVAVYGEFLSCKVASAIDHYGANVLYRQLVDCGHSGAQCSLGKGYE